MIPKRTQLPLALLAVALMAAPGCAGDLYPAGAQGDSGVLRYGDAGVPRPGVDAQPAAPDSAAPRPDSAPPRPDSAPPKPDSAPPKPDSAPPPTGNAGQPCPCTGSALCVENVCRALCVPPGDPCGAVGNCPADQACVELSKTQGVCVPGLKPGAPCGPAAQGGFCRVNYVCASVNNAPYVCLPVCTNPKGNCANGAPCMAALEGCSFCAAP